MRGRVSSTSPGRRDRGFRAVEGPRPPSAGARGRVRSLPRRLRLAARAVTLDDQLRLEGRLHLADLVEDAERPAEGRRARADRPHPGDGPGAGGRPPSPRRLDQGRGAGCRARYGRVRDRADHRSGVSSRAGFGRGEDQPASPGRSLFWPAHRVDHRDIEQPHLVTGRWCATPHSPSKGRR